MGFIEAILGAAADGMNKFVKHSTPHIIRIVGGGELVTWRAAALVKEEEEGKEGEREQYDSIV